MLESAAANRGEAPSPFILRLSRRQNLPEVDASQVLSGEIDAATLAGLIALVEPANPGAMAGDAYGAAQTSSIFQALSASSTRPPWICSLSLALA